ncbi:DUF421 domain-containing protein [Cytobacillus spongiae]|jgi:uncharacterized membrane protein YcaP (DUF421 family)|uniref:DUF421 domain-containing protein n=1 Tax=Cytobacillus spongiae TaxID=2901381 RepID=UPI001F178174|nr:DUF421 domain-containing protein [Cytobacillus spongiae]UII57048.1 DUF421 domain-containing protein [Cytobacillus spongiae]
MSTIVETIIRSLFIIVGLFIITKLLGKKQLSKLSFFEYIAGITVGDIAGTLSMDPELSLRDGVTALLIWSFVPLFISIYSLKNKKFRDIVEGKPTIFIEKGKVLEKNLKKERYSADELLEQLRTKNVFQVADVEFASLDSNGDLSVLLKKGKQPVRVEDLFNRYHEESEPQTIISDGSLDEEKLNKASISRGWIEYELAKRELTVEDVFLGQITSNGELSFDLYNDDMKEQQVDDEEFLGVLLTKLQADFAWNSSIVTPPYLKRMYGQYSEELAKLMCELALKRKDN